jgi:glycosyltransferase involved in cell wall biosynthesis
MDLMGIGRRHNRVERTAVGIAPGDQEHRSDAPAVTVVIPTHNRATLLRRTVSSVLAQRGCSIELVVVDDGSTDDTAFHLAAFRDPRLITIRHTTPQGVSQARNAGLERARGRWVAFIDDDDLWAPTKIASQLAAADSAPAAGWVLVGEVVVDPTLRILAARRPPTTNQLRRVLCYNVVPGGGSGAMIRTDLARAEGGFDPQLSTLADWDLWIRLFLRSPAVAVQRPLVAYTRHPSSMSHDVQRVQQEFDIVIQRYAGAREAHKVALLHSIWFLWRCTMYLHTGDRRAALSSAVRVIRPNEAVEFTRTAVAWLGQRHLVPPVWLADARRWLSGYQ